MLIRHALPQLSTLFAAKLGRYPKYWRLSFHGAVLGWTAAAMVYSLGPAILRPAIVLWPLSFTALWLLHIIRFGARAMRSWPEPRAGDLAPGCSQISAVPTLRTVAVPGHVTAGAVDTVIAQMQSGFEVNRRGVLGAGAKAAGVALLVSLSLVRPLAGQTGGVGDGCPPRLDMFIVGRGTDRVLHVGTWDKRYATVDGIRIGTSEKSILVLMGPPNTIKVDDQGTRVLSYNNMFLRVEPSGGVSSIDVIVTPR